jgi:bifunctional enzyme CysN/CysC
VKPGDKVRCCRRAAKPPSPRIVTRAATLQKPSPASPSPSPEADEVDTSARRRHRRRCNDPPEVSDQFQVKLLWMSDEPMLPGRPISSSSPARKTVGRSVNAENKVNVNTMEHGGQAPRTQRIGVTATSRSTKPIAFDPYTENRLTGSFILIDRFTNATVGHGPDRLRCAAPANIHWQAVDVTSATPAPPSSRQKPAVPVVHRPVRCRQVDHRQPGREAAAGRMGHTPICSMATTSAMASTVTSASPMPTASRTSAASPKSRS